MNKNAALEIASILNCDADTLNEHSAIGVVPEWDSLAHVKILMYLQENYGIEINEQTMNHFTRLTNIAELIECHGD